MPPDVPHWDPSFRLFSVLSLRAAPRAPPNGEGPWPGVEGEKRSPWLYAESEVRNELVPLPVVPPVPLAGMLETSRETGHQVSMGDLRSNLKSSGFKVKCESKI